MANRRYFLKLVGGGVVLAAAGAAGFATTRTPHRALAPWKKAGDYEDIRKQALSYALLAPNPHNRQPWLADLSRSENTVVIYRDRKRNLPETDPFERQLTIGMGCFLELLVIAAGNTGHRCALDLFPEPEKGVDGPVAIATFSPGGTLDPLFAHVLDRRSCKEPYSERAVSAEIAERLSDFAQVTTDQTSVAHIRNLTWDAWLTEAETPRTFQESIDLMRYGKQQINANPDGIDLGGPFLEALMLVGVLGPEQQADRNSTAYQEGVRIYREMLLATPAYAHITSQGNSRINQIEAGRKWLRLNLETTRLGLSLHPVSQALQEFPEMSQHYKRAHQLLAQPGETVQMLGRLGYGPDVSQSPRWPLEAKLIS